MALSPLPDKLFFKIGEVADIVGVKPHVLRYWESEFRVLRPKKTRGAHRMYSRRDVELAVYIRRLLHDEGYSISGARRKLRTKAAREPERGAVREASLRADMLQLREDLLDVIAMIDALDGKAKSDTTITVTVQQVVPNTVPVRR